MKNVYVVLQKFMSQFPEALLFSLVPLKVITIVFKVNADVGGARRGWYCVGI